MTRTVAALILLFFGGACDPSDQELLPEGVIADKVLVIKHEKKLMLLKDEKILKTYRAALGRQRGKKTHQGDNKTPEGFYRFDAVNRASGYHLAMHISYPNASDVATAQKLGKPPGGDIMLHGIKNGAGWIGGFHSLINWTQGCIAVTDEEIEEIVKAVPLGTPIEIQP